MDNWKLRVQDRKSFLLRAFRNRSRNRSQQVLLHSTIRTPEVGDCVYIGLHSTILGGITIGDDVMIAPNTFVNQNVPSHSIVIGNPCKIISRENATSEYIYYRV